MPVVTAFVKNQMASKTRYTFVSVFSSGFSLPLHDARACGGSVRSACVRPRVHAP